MPAAWSPLVFIVIVWSSSSSRLSSIYIDVQPTSSDLAFFDTPDTLRCVEREGCRFFVLAVGPSLIDIDCPLRGRDPTPLFVSLHLIANEQTKSQDNIPRAHCTLPSYINPPSLRCGTHSVARFRSRYHLVHVSHRYVARGYVSWSASDG